MIYLDNAATTKVSKEVLKAMLPYLTDVYGNPNSVHPMGQKAYIAVENAREQVSKAIGVKRVGGVFFTSGATEANNIVLHSFPMHRVYCGDFEHPSVVNPVRKCSPFTPSFKLNRNGCIDVDDLTSKVRGKTSLVSVMLVNNETGAINDVKAIADWCHERGMLVHSDCTQALGVMPIDVEKLGVDFATFSGHKIHSPKGVGALYAKDASLLKPLFFGGNNQELGIRPGTENVPSIVGFGKACEIIHDSGEDLFSMIQNIKVEFNHALFEALSESTLNEYSINGGDAKYGKIINVRFHGIDADRLMLLLSQCGVCVSKGSACRSGKSTVSPTLLAMGLSEKEASECIRFSVSKYTTLGEILKATYILRDCLRALV